MAIPKDSPWTVGIAVSVLFVLSACARTPSTMEGQPTSAGIEGPSLSPTSVTTELDMSLTAASVTATPSIEATRVPQEKIVTTQPTILNTHDASPTSPVMQARMPIFVEIIKVPLSPDSSDLMPPADVGPIGVFAFDPSSRVLLVQPSIQILSTTKVLIGLTEGFPGAPYICSELSQIPSAQTALLTVVAIDADTDTVTVTYGEHTFELGPDQSLAFKEAGQGELIATRVTTIINHGRPSALGVLPTDPASR